MVVRVGGHPSLDELLNVASRRIHVRLSALDSANDGHDRLAVRSFPVDVNHCWWAVDCFTVGVEARQVNEEVGVVPLLHKPSQSVQAVCRFVWDLHTSS